MKVFRELEDLPHFKNVVLTIGSFDGIHAGHQQIIKRINQIAKDIGGESMIITFHPHPRMVILPKNASNLRLITTLDERIEIFRNLGIDNLVIVPFTKAFSQQTPDEYIESFLVKHFQPKCIVIGYDHKFGNKRAGNIDYLKRFETTFGFKVLEIGKHEVENIAVSSTKIRKALELGDVVTAAQLLKHPYTLSGKVVKGKQIGRTIGYPTANIEIDFIYKLIPLEGIYAVKVFYENKTYQAMLYIGNRPTLNGVERSIEVNIFDFDQDIYDEILQLEFVERIRDDIKFDGLEKLKQRIAQDKIETLAIFSKIENE